VKWAFSLFLINKNARTVTKRGPISCSEALENVGEQKNLPL